MSRLGQYNDGVLHKLPGRSFLEAPLYSSRASLEVGWAQLVLAESKACARQIEPGSRHAISEQCPLRRVDALPTIGSGNMGNLRQARGRPFHLRRQNSLPNLFFRRTGMCWPTTSLNLLLYAFLSIALIPQVIRWIMKQKHRVLLVAPLWRNQHWSTEMARLLTAALWPIRLRRDLLSQANGMIWHPQPDLWALHLWPLDGSLRTFPRVC